MKTLLTIILLAFSSAALAEICTTLTPSTLPRQDLRLREAYVQFLPHETLGGTAVAIGYLTVNQGQICCSVSHFDGASVNALLVSQHSALAAPVSEVAIGMWSRLPWSNRAPASPWAQRVCQNLANKMATDGVLESYRVVRNTRRADGSRPMFILNTAGAMVNLRVSGAQVYVEPNRICEATPVVNTTSDGLWLYVTNAAGVRGIALCKLQ